MQINCLIQKVRALTMEAAFPQACMVCNRHVGGEIALCKECLRILPYNFPACGRCALPTTSPEVLCAGCIQDPPFYEAAVSAFRYEGLIRDLHRQFKFQAWLPGGAILSRLLSEQLATRIDRLPDTIIPVPLHRRRLRSRGFNQSAELLRPLARRLQVPVDQGLCTRIRDTEVQSRLSREQRRRNLMGAYTASAMVKGMYIAIFDDVVTTGYTVNELSRVLKQQGAARIEVWSCARAPGRLC